MMDNFYKDAGAIGKAKTITLKDFLDLCSNEDITIVVKMAGEGRLYSGAVRELKDYNDVLPLPTMSCQVRRFFINTEETMELTDQKSSLYIVIEERD